ncbi:non-hydrolyzing UDP-N-acetylglucosamine 2-epimerase [uncultured Finegoldia sp.]|uniref:non-hydrolyzing UDP-N-acetylglucosamine 2-epimerase n=1 Tax=uncultured Finegoldia sp. TaxID=328009 RepID=UPI0026144655|nr:UDP-N-acetylglucosamine 2-epimerase (non-hydrolyzing) [uncultured Finegoldia sp.]
MKIVTVVGARPQFIKAAMVSKELRKNFEEVMIHTGQHFDYNMSEVFFEEMNIPYPDYNLGISGGSHAEMTGKMLIEIEKILVKENPDMVLLYGDTNSTLAGSLAAVKLHIPICHVEAGNRLGTLDNPEEVNRIMTDHCSKVLCCCTKSALEFLKEEGLQDRATLVGDPMYDAFLQYSKQVGDTIPEKVYDIYDNEVKIPSEFYYLTCHRAENTQSIEPLSEILSAMEELDEKCIYPVHPRNQKMVRELSEKHNYQNIIFLKPVGYMMSVYLVNHSKKIVTDSGGLQREAYFARKQCVTIFNHVVWPETMTKKRNQLSKPLKNEILKLLNEKVDFEDYDYPFGDGHSSAKIIECINKFFEK